MRLPLKITRGYLVPIAGEPGEPSAHKQVSWSSEGEVKANYAPPLASEMDATSAASNSQGAISALPVERADAPCRPSTTSAADSFNGPRPEPCAGGLDASAAAGGGGGGGGDGNGEMNGGSVHKRNDTCNDDDDDLADLADVDVHVALHDMDDSETDDEDNNADPSTANNEVTARAPSIVNGWDDNAVASCFERAIRMHSRTAAQLAQETNGDGWEAGPNALPATMARSTENGAASSNPAENEVATTSISDHFGENEGGLSEEDQKKPWKPRPLPLPAWAVDPIYAAANLTSRGLGDMKQTPA